MKKNLSFIIIALSCALVAFSCSKEVEPIDDNTNPAGEVVDPVQPVGEPITISATLSDALTKVTFTPGLDGSSKPMFNLTWASTDKLRVADASDNSSYSDFDLVSGEGTNSATFSGTPVSATSYDVWVLHEDVNNTQTQASDGDASHLQYIAQATGITDLTTAIDFTEVSSVLGLQVKLPTGVTATISSVELTSTSAIFFGGKVLTINIDAPGDTDSDNILNLYATLPSGSTDIPTGTTIYLKFIANSGVKYTTYRALGSGLKFASGKLNNLKMNCTTDGSNGLQTWSGNGTDGNPYLIDTPYKLAVVNLLATGGQTTYFKMTADVDMNEVPHISINTNSGYTQLVNFDGNNKTISNLGKNFFYVFKGSIQNLTLSGSSVTSRGIFAEYCQETGHTITNVDIIGGSIESGNANVGAMIGNINSGIADVTSVTITDCDITNTIVKGSNNVGGLIGAAQNQTVVESCTVAKADTGTPSVQATSGSNCGGLIGSTTGPVTITDCTVSGTNVTGTGVVGGVVGFANSLVTISGSKYTGGTVQASNRYCGGFLGSTKDVASVITDCQVEDATVNTTYDDDSRCGGFVGQLQTSCQVKGCTVGTPSTKVTVNSKQPKRTGSGTTESPYVYSKINVGGFVGVNYGTITKNGDVHSKAYVKITSNNTYGAPLDLGGFVGFGRGTIEYCDAIVDMTSLKGQYIGGFAGYVVNAGTVIDNCTVDGTVTGNNYTGGFAGYVDSGAPVISNCTASGSVTAQSGAGGFIGTCVSGSFTNDSSSATTSVNGSNSGGFCGRIDGSVSFSKCHFNGSFGETGTGSSHGGFIGAILGEGTVSVEKCYTTCNVTSDASSVSPFIGMINHASAVVTVSNCYATGNIINSNQLRGGIIANASVASSVSVSNCYASGSIVGSFRLGGIIGNLNLAGTVTNCVAWNSGVTASSVGNGNWSSGAVIGTAFPTSTLTNNYRKPGMPVKAFWGNVTGYTWELTSDYNHPNVDSENPLIIREKSTGTFRSSTATALASGQDNYPIFPYHGKVEAGKTLSQLASTTLGWSSDVWDFTGDLPTLK